MLVCIMIDGVWISCGNMLVCIMIDGVWIIVLFSFSFHLVENVFATFNDLLVLAVITVL